MLIRLADVAEEEMMQSCTGCVRAPVARAFIALLGLTAACGCESEPTCGNGVVEGPEECDDGRNGMSMDGCTDECRFSCNAAECRHALDGCADAHCVPTAFGRICEWSDYVGQCRYSGCPMDIGVCQDGVCVCDSLPDGGPDGDADAFDGGETESEVVAETTEL